MNGKINWLYKSSRAITASVRHFQVFFGVRLVFQFLVLTERSLYVGLTKLLDSPFFQDLILRPLSCALLKHLLIEHYFFVFFAVVNYNLRVSNEYHWFNGWPTVPTEVFAYLVM